MNASGDPARKRPRTLAEVARRSLAGEQSFDLALREFLDTFYTNAAQRAASVDQQPDMISPLADAYLAATAEHLAAVHGIPCPGWTERHGRALIKPFFAGGLESTKACLTVESPTAFRRRMLFVGRDALARPRMETPLVAGANASIVQNRGERHVRSSGFMARQGASLKRFSAPCKPAYPSD